MKLILAICIISLSGLAAFSQADGYKKFSTDTEVPRMTIEEAKKAFDEGTVVFVDARAADAYRQDRIKGSVLIEGAKDDRFDSLPKGKKIVVYCSWPAENSSARLAFQMNQKGIANVYALKGGFQGWKAANYPSESTK